MTLAHRSKPVSTKQAACANLGSERMRQRLKLRQSQALVMTPQLVQAMKLLQLSNLDLAGYVREELEQNPLLECSDEIDKLPFCEERPGLTGGEPFRSSDP